MRFRFANPDDAEFLAPLNAQLIRDEGHGNSMTVAELAERMKNWLSGDYRAVVFEDSDDVVGYALFRREPEFIYLRQLFVRSEYRRRGIGRDAIIWLRRNAWAPDARVRVDVLVGNVIGQSFWREVGFREYCITLEQAPQNAA
jgi:GNAT superfamily N-acetyltransferase